MKVLVTGAAGFLGARVVEALTHAGHHALAVRRTDCDLADTAGLRALLEAHRPEAVLHLAWYTKHPAYWSATENLDSVAQSMQLLRIAKATGCRRFVGAGTCAEYDWSHCDLVENVTPCLPRTLYGASKLAVCSIGERFIEGFAWARFNFLFGRGDGRLISTAIAALGAGEDFACSSGEQIRDFMHVDDAAAAMVALLESDVRGPVNIGSGESRSVRSIVETVADLLGGRGKPQFGGLPRTDDTPALIPRLDRLTTEVGWRPRMSVRERIAGMLAP